MKFYSILLLFLSPPKTEYVRFQGRTVYVCVFLWGRYLDKTVYWLAEKFPYIGKKV